MTPFRLHRKTCSKAKPGASPREQVEYLKGKEREGVYGEVEKHILHPTNPVRGDLVHVEFHNMQWINNDAVKMFELAYAHGPKNDRWAVKWEMMLSRDLSREDQLALTREFIQTHCEKQSGFWVIHEPVGSDGKKQPHVHFMFNEKIREPDETRSPEQFFRKYNYRNPERGGAAKDPIFTEQRSTQLFRESWERLSNYYLEIAGSPERVDSRSCAARGLPKHHEYFLPTDAEKKVYDINPAYTPQMAFEAEKQARERWEGWKDAMGYPAEIHAVYKDLFLDNERRMVRESTPGHYVEPEVYREHILHERQEIQAELKKLEQVNQSFEREHTFAQRYSQEKMLGEHSRVNTGQVRTPAIERAVAPVRGLSKLLKDMEHEHDEQPQRGTSFRFEKDRDEGIELGL